ncbi:MAG: UDP-N-acetylmuramoyl-L-alanyl-D-glutamate--2,6-diaminopimelate ligase [Puniceicoccales bacterium]|nr:UDP-N-acetylmuramoyl-L-alanyl-D-glutamate--2,6-diaminopimelate ligase [Puniceicoccales bacterium]
MTAATLKTLLADIPDLVWTGPKDDVRVHNLALHHETVIPNSLFFAFPGHQTDGHRFIHEAISRGANVVVSERPFKPHGNLVHIQSRNVRSLAATLAKRFFGAGDERLNLIGITGTSGKSTVAGLLKHVLCEGYGEKTGLLGTLQYDLGERLLPAVRTTPDVLSFHRFLNEMGKASCRNAVVEVTSHALEQERVRGARFQTAVFNNLSHEHLDYHGTMEAYFEAKKKLFQSSPGRAIINVDDPFGRRLWEEFSSSGTSFGMSHAATLRAENRVHIPEGTRFDFVSPDGRWKVLSPLVGDFNVFNVLAVLAVVYAEGRPIPPALQALKTFGGVPGRMERFVRHGLQVYVDYAHKPDALENVLSTLRPLTKGRLNVVFGCGGNRDRSKRPQMMAVAQKWADFCWVTSDNVRFETAAEIFEDMKSGISDFQRLQFVEDRRDAIGQAFSQCQPGDILLVAGKGHECFQEVRGQRLPFCDVEVIKSLLIRD